MKEKKKEQTKAEFVRVVLGRNNEYGRAIHEVDGIRYDLRLDEPVLVARAHLTELQKNQPYLKILED